MSDPIPSVALFDTVVHTCGEQALPILMGCLAVPAKRHVFVCSEKTAPLISLICREAAIAGHCTTTVEVHPYDITAIADRLDAALGKRSGSVGVNITGGTKPMSIACLTSALRKGWEAFYIDTTGRQIIWLSGNRRRELLRPLFTSVDPFIRLGSTGILNPSAAAPTASMKARRQLTLTIARKLAGPVNKIAQRLVREKLPEKPGVAFEVAAGKAQARLTAEGEARLITSEDEFRFGEMPDFSAYLAGGWMEEFSFWKLEPLRREGKIFDLRLNLSTTSGNGNFPQQRANQEIDLLFTDGYDLLLIECKSGSVRQEHIQKLENLTSRYGGVFGKGLLLSAFPPLYGTFPDRVRNSRNIACIAGHAIHDLPNHVLSVSPGEFIGGKRRK